MQNREEGNDLKRVPSMPMIMSSRVVKIIRDHFPKAAHALRLKAGQPRLKNGHHDAWEDQAALFLFRHLSHAGLDRLFGFLVLEDEQKAVEVIESIEVTA
jgi:hypothetical protein